MNLVQFLNKVDNTVSDMTKEQMQFLIHELARTLPENGRNQFLESMNIVQKEECCIAVQEDKHYEDFYSKIKTIKEILKSINEGTRCLDSEYNEEWDEWYNDDVDDILFRDPEKIIPDIEDAISLLHQCVDMEEYKEGRELAELLSVLEVFVTGDYLDYYGEPLDVGRLYDYQLIDGSLEKVVKESLFLTYMGNELSDRAEEMYCVMSDYHYGNVTLESIMQEGKKELPEFKEFLLLWIDYLGNRTEFGVEKLLLEAQAMLEDDEQCLKMVRKFAVQHPELYQQVLEKGLKGEKMDKMLQIGLEALENIPVTYIIRSEIALLTAEFAIKLNNNAVAENCWLEAFRSDSTVVNYMRIRLMANDWNQYKKQVKQIYSEVYERTKQESNINIRSAYGNLQKTNSLHRNDYCALLFFDGEFETVIQLGLSEKYALGWSSTFMKVGLALFLLLLYKGKNLSQGLTAMLERIVSKYEFQADKFLKGTCINNTKSDVEFCWQLFEKWKAEYEISKKDSEKWLKMIDQYVSMRTVGIMEGNHRGYYGECAALIAAYGEVCESRGGEKTKADIMGKYKAQYSRRRAFHQELRNYGM